MLTADKVKVPLPDFVNVELVPEIIPEIEPAPVLLIATDEPVAVAIAPAEKVPVVTERPVTGVAPPTAPLKVVLAAVLVEAVRLYAPLTAPPTLMLPVAVDAESDVLAPNVTAPVYVCAPEVVTELASVLVPLTVRLDVPAELVMEGVVPPMNNEPIAAGT